MQYDDLQSVPDGDSGFVGVDMLTDPRQLAPGYAAQADNKDFRHRTARTRGGMVAVPWARESGVYFDIEFPAVFDVPMGFGRVYGEFDFADPQTGREFTILAMDCGAYIIEPNAVPRVVLYPVEDAGVWDEVTMSQAFDVVLMHRGESRSTLKWDPYDDERWVYVEDFAAERAANTDPDNTYGDGTLLLPSSAEAIAFNGRVYVVYNRDNIAAGDIFDYTRYSPATSRFRINNGDAGEIVKLWGFNQIQIIVFKERRIDLLGNVYGDLGDITNDNLSTEFGCVAKKTVVQVGSDVWFLSYGGVFSIGQALENKLQGDTVPISRPIDPLMRRINWKAVKGAAAAYADNRYYLAVPIDGALYNNYLLVYDYLNRSWSGRWTHQWMDVHGFARMSSNRNRELFSVGGHTRADEGVLMRFDDALEDRYLSASAPVVDRVRSRGFGAERSNSKTAVSVLMELETRQPQMTVKALLPDVNHEQVLIQDETRNPLAYYEFGKADWDPTNVNGDHGEPGREDYEVFADPYPQNIVVSGAGISGVNGDYVYAGLIPAGNPNEGERYYAQVDGSYKLYQDTIGRWSISGSFLLASNYVNDAIVDLPPKTGWQNGPLGLSPAPTLAYEVGRYELEVPFNPDLAQRVQRSLRASARGSFMQVEVSNETGRLELHSLRTDALQGARSLRLNA